MSVTYSVSEKMEYSSERAESEWSCLSKKSKNNQKMYSVLECWFFFLGGGVTHFVIVIHTICFIIVFNM